MSATPAHTLAPSTSATVVLNLGPGIGALLLHTGPQELHREIEISPAGAPHTRAHAAVRERILPTGSRFAALFVDLAPGDYTLWHDAETPAVTVTVTEGSVTEQTWIS
jgi:quercetin dioxygenase-like cupin family protein